MRMPRRTISVNNEEDAPIRHDHDDAMGTDMDAAKVNEQQELGNEAAKVEDEDQQYPVQPEQVQDTQSRVNQSKGTGEHVKDLLAKVSAHQEQQKEQQRKQPQASQSPAPRKPYIPRTPPSVISIRSSSSLRSLTSTNAADNNNTQQNNNSTTGSQTKSRKRLSWGTHEELGYGSNHSKVTEISHVSMNTLEQQPENSDLSLDVDADEDGRDSIASDAAMDTDQQEELQDEEKSTQSSCALLGLTVASMQDYSITNHEGTDHIQNFDLGANGGGAARDVKSPVNTKALDKRASSDYWKGLLVGLFVCQAVFIPLWTAFSTGSWQTVTSLASFLWYCSWKLVVISVTGAGFVGIGVIAVELDRSQKMEVEALQHELQHLQATVKRLHSQQAVEQPTRYRWQRQSPPSFQRQPTAAITQQALVVREEEERSIAVTAPSTTSTFGGDTNIRPGRPSSPLTTRQTTSTTTINDANDSKESTNLLPKREQQQDRLPTKVIRVMSTDNREVSASTGSTTKMSTISKESLPSQLTADFYPEATVAIVSISGFSAWSSAREPIQIFELLERLHVRFDGAAERLGVFTQQGRSDSYMACTGVLEPQPDHAIIMVKFAKTILQNMSNIVQGLESKLGPATGDMRLRIGIHSGSVTAGNLGGQFQVVGSSIEMASAMQATGQRHRIQISHTTAEILKEAGKDSWIRKRVNPSTDMFKPGAKETYWVVPTSPLSGRGNTSSYQSERSLASLRSARSGKLSPSIVKSLSGTATCDNTPQRPKRRQVWGDGEDNFILSLPPMSRSAKNTRMIGWVVKLLQTKLVKVIAQHGGQGKITDFEIDATVLSRVRKGASVPVEEVVDAIRQTSDQFPSDHSGLISNDPSDSNDVDIEVARQLRDMVTKISGLYNDENPFSNFEKASHVMMAANKLLSRCMALDSDDMEMSASGASLSSMRHYMRGISSLGQFGILFAALVSNLGHEGISSRQLTRLYPKLSEEFQHESVSEQQSITLAWDTLMDPSFKELRQCLFTNEDDLLRFRQLLVNGVLATDLSNEKAQEKRTRRWDRAFHIACDSSSIHEEDIDLKATVVVECLMQASDLSHMMQHWKTYQKFSERCFREKCIAFESGRSQCDPPETWYREELEFFDNHAIPLAKRLSVSKVFGVASDECLNHALSNRKEWARQGEALVEEMHSRYTARKKMEIGGFTNEEINNFTPKELEYIMKKLVEKGRNNGTIQVDAEKGQHDAAQAWLDALEIYERCPAAMEIGDRTILFPIYSGVFVWIKGGKIQDPDGNVELNLAHNFVKESKLHLDPVHYTRALAMQAEVYGRRGNYTAALKEFEKLADIYNANVHSLPIAEVYGTDRSAQAYAFSAIWRDQLGNTEKALAACEYCIQDILPTMDATNTLGNFEILLSVIRVLKPRGQEERMLRLFDEYVTSAFYKHYGPSGFTPCMCLFKPLTYLLQICRDPHSFDALDEAADWLCEDDNGVVVDFMDSLFAKMCWSSFDLVAELCLRVANRLSLEDRDVDKQRIIIAKGLMLVEAAERKMRDEDGNVILPLAFGMHEPVFNALQLVAEQMGVQKDDGCAPCRVLDVTLPPSYLKAPGT